MLVLDKVLVATDFSPVAQEALRHALGIASRCQADVSLVHVIDAALYGLAPDGIASAVECAERDADLLMKQLNREGIISGSPPELMITVGPVWPTISNAIDEKCPGLLVLGTHGRSGLAKLFLGSVAERALREASCPVLTVGPHVRSSKVSGTKAKHFLVPTDLSPESTHALAYGMSLAKAEADDVTLLHVLNPHPGDPAKTAPSASEVKNQLAKVLDQNSDAAAIVSPRVEFGAPAPTIVAVAEQMRSDLIVMGLRAWSTDGAPMWRTAYEVVIHARCPVLSMKSPARWTSGT